MQSWLHQWHLALLLGSGPAALRTPPRAHPTSIPVAEQTFHIPQAAHVQHCSLDMTTAFGPQKNLSLRQIVMSQKFHRRQNAVCAFDRTVCTLRISLYSLRLYQDIALPTSMLSAPASRPIATSLVMYTQTSKATADVVVCQFATTENVDVHGRGNCTLICDTRFCT